MMVKLKSLLQVTRYMCSAYALYMTRFLQLCYYGLVVDLNFSSKDYETLRKRSDCEGFQFFTQCLPLLGKALEHGIANERFTCPTDFKCQRNSALPRLMGLQFSSIFFKDGSLRPDACLISVASIRQMCYYAYKADFPASKGSDQRVVSEFVRCDNELNDLHIPNDALVKMASLLVASVFNKTPSYGLPSHGPGVTSNVPLTEKWEHRLNVDSALYGRFGSRFFFNANDAMDRIHRYPVYRNDTYFNTRSVEAKVILVPKDSRGPRLISCEPCEHQFIQQMIMDYMVRTIERSPLTMGFVNFTDQSVNRELAKSASTDRQMSTLDLKEASDRNSLQLFYKLFNLVPELRDDIIACRTSSTLLPNGDSVKLRKFAPMGSALCFPTMAISIWAVIKAGFISIGEATAPCYVYGDDIIVPTHLAHVAIHVLERVGFLVNRSKSFIGSRFAESCGADCFDGHDVTPTRLRKLWNLHETTNSGIPKVLVAMVKHANSMDHLPCTQEIFYSFVESFLGCLPYGSVRSPYLCRTSLDPWRDQRSAMRHKNKKGDRPRTYNAWKVVTLPQRAQATGWGHLFRCFGTIGRQLESPPSFGLYDLPKRWNLVRRRFAISDLI